jgi:nucleotide-binding universal stress UspA family protein
MSLGRWTSFDRGGRDGSASVRGATIVKRILVPLDGSRLSEGILPLATVMGHGHGAELLLIRVLSRHESPEVHARAHQEAEAYLSGIAAQLSTHDVAVRWTVSCGPPNALIVDAARDREVDLVMMSTHGRGAVLPSVAERVVRQAPVPVLLVRGELAWEHGHVGRIVVPLDGSGLSASILPLVAQLAAPFDFTIDLLRAVEPLPAYASIEVSAAKRDEMRRLHTADAEEYLTKVAGPLEALGLRVTRSIAYGLPGAAIVGHAHEAGAGLIAMSTHGRTGLSRLLLGSVAEEVMRAAAVPLLLWKAPSPSPTPAETTSC